MRQKVRAEIISTEGPALGLGFCLSARSHSHARVMKTDFAETYVRNLTLLNDSFLQPLKRSPALYDLK
jgi:hypothetical protein